MSRVTRNARGECVRAMVLVDRSGLSSTAVAADTISSGCTFMASL